MDKLFRRNLPDLVRGIRANKKDEHKFITRAIQEIKDEVKQPSKEAKVVAIQKLTYLHMLGYDMTWAAFHIIEVMSQESFGAKRIGYLAASQCFNEHTEVIMLATNLLKRDITSVNEYETGVALNALANICTPDLAQDLAADTLALVTSSRPYVRKKATLVLYKIFLRFPQALRPSFPRLKEKLEDPDPAVVSAAVNVICELARKNPKNYLPLAPVFFKLLTTSNNNWMLIKIIKLMGALTPYEKRLAKKLVAPLTDIMNSTPAMSLLFECINTCTIGLSEFTNVIRLCIAKLRLFIEDSDQNLKYLGLLALYNIMKTHPKAVLEHRDMVIFCLDDEDITIRQRALELLTGMVNRRNLIDIIGKLMDKLEEAEGSYRDDLVLKVIEICSQENYKFITDFEWYINVLMELTHIGRTCHGAAIREQFMDVCIRVQVTRAYGVQSMITLLKDPRMVGENPTAGGMCEVLYAAAYIIGEFGSNSKHPNVLLECLLQPLAVSLPGHVQAVFVHNAVKIACSAIANQPAKAADVMALLDARLPVFAQSTFLEVQERACFASELVALLKESASPAALAGELVAVFAEALNPVAARAQKKVPVPAGVDLDAEINSPPPSDDEEDLYRRDDDPYRWDDGSDDERHGGGAHREEWEAPRMTSEERRQQKERRRQKESSNPFYLGGSPMVREDFSDEEYGGVETLTPDMLDMDGPLPSVEVGGGRQRPRAARGSKRRKPQKVVVLAADEMPEGANESDDEAADEGPVDELSGIDLTSDLRPEEALQKPKSYPLPGAAPEPAPAKERPERGERRRRRRPRGEEGAGGGDERRRRRRGEKDGRGGEERRRKRRPEERKPAASGNLLGLEDAAPAAAPAAAAAPARSGDLLGLSSGGSDATATATATASAPAKQYSAVQSPVHPTASSSDVSRAAVGGAAQVSTAGKGREVVATYSLRVNPSQPDKVLVVMDVRNRSKRAAVSRVEFRLKESPKTRLCPTSSPRMSGDVPPGESRVHSLLFEFDSFLKTQVVKGGLAFKVDGEVKKMRLEVVIPASTFIQPVDVTEDQLAEIMKSNHRSLVSASCTLAVQDVRAAIAKLADTLHLKIVSVSDSVLMYGCSIQNHHVCLLVKRQEGGKVLKVDVKTSERAFSESLVSELEAAFQ